MAKPFLAALDRFDAGAIRSELTYAFWDAIERARRRGRLGTDPAEVGAILRRISAAVYDMPGPSHNGCVGVNCPVTADAAHSRHVMSDLAFWTDTNREDAHVPVVDGLSPAEIIHLEGHAVATQDSSLLDAFQWGDLRPGDPASFGAVMVRIPLPPIKHNPNPVAKFVIAVSGAPRTVDHAIASGLGAVLEGSLIADDHIPLASPPEGPFVIGADPEAVAAHVAARTGR